MGHWVGTLRYFFTLNKNKLFLTGPRYDSLIIHENKLLSYVSYCGVIIWDTDSYEIIRRFFIYPNFHIDYMSIYKNNLYVESPLQHLEQQSEHNSEQHSEK